MLYTIYPYIWIYGIKLRFIKCADNEGKRNQGVCEE